MLALLAVHAYVCVPAGIPEVAQYVLREHLVQQIPVALCLWPPSCACLSCRAHNAEDCLAAAQKSVLMQKTAEGDSAASDVAAVTASSAINA